MDDKVVQWKKDCDNVAINRIVSRLGAYDLQGFLHWIYLKLRGKSIVLMGSCHGCGTCCRSISLEGKKGWLRSEKDFKMIADKYHEYDKFLVQELKKKR